MSDHSRRPGTVMFVAIVLFVFGTGYILNAIFTGAVAAYFAIYPDAPDPNARAWYSDMVASIHFFTTEIPHYVPIAIAFSAVDLIFGFLQLVLGIGVLRLRSAARNRVIVLVLAKFLYMIGYQTFAIVMVLPASVRFAQLHPPPVPGGGPPPFDLGVIAQVTMLGGVCVDVALQIAVTVLIVSVLCSAKVKAAFAGLPPPTEASPPPVKPPSLYTGYEDDETQPA